MKINWNLKLIATLVLLLGTVPGWSQIQTYSYSSSVEGVIDLYSGGVGWGGTETLFETITGTLTYNPATQTLVDAATLTVAQASGSFDIYSASTPPVGRATSTGVATTPPPPIGLVTYTIGDNGAFSVRLHFYGSDRRRKFRTLDDACYSCEWNN